MQPQLPTADKLLPYLERIDEARTYSNFGPLYNELSERLAEYFKVDKAQVALIANGTLALQAAVETVGDVGDTWIVPSFTFVASGQAVMSARRRIHFVDVELDSWAMAPVERPFARGHLVVAPFGARPQVERWMGVSGPKVFDAASCFDACNEIGGFLPDDSMIMVSLHATKTLPAGEGAVLIGPKNWVKRAATWANFGFSGSRFASGPGMNAKLSEYHAAVGLSSLDSWSSDLEKWRQVRDLATDAVLKSGLEVQPSFLQGFVTSTWNVRIPSGIDLDATRNRMEHHGVSTRSWWPAGVHLMPAFSRQTLEPLPNTEELVLTTLGLPFGRELTKDDISRVINAVGHSLAQ
jgi:dTDP-4-amino-4,6-dideoxygalactose transaminase